MDYPALSNSAGDADQLFGKLAHQLAAEGRWHELFEARLTEARHRLGLSLTDPPRLDDLPEEQRAVLENDYTAACREVGRLLTEAGKLREAWQYLRPGGEKHVLHAALSRAVPSEENIDELVELALYEAVDAERGFGWLLGHSGTCNAITALEGLASSLLPADLLACAAALIRHVDRELRENLLGLLAETENREPHEPLPNTEAKLGELWGGCDWLFENEAVHIDASHLAATVRFARLVVDPPVVELALGLTDYGSRLHESLQYSGDAPFEDLYPAHRRFFLATLGKEVEEATHYFRRQAEQSDVYHEGTAAIETLLVLLDRIGQPGEALAVYEKMVPQEAQLSPLAPRAIDLARKSRDWDLFEKMLRQRDDPVGLATGLLVRDGNL